jgi:hypothetical protein
MTAWPASWINRLRRRAAVFGFKLRYRGGDFPTYALVLRRHDGTGGDIIADLDVLADWIEKLENGETIEHRTSCGLPLWRYDPATLRRNAKRSKAKA